MSELSVALGTVVFVTVVWWLLTMCWNMWLGKKENEVAAVSLPSGVAWFRPSSIDHITKVRSATIGCEFDILVGGRLVRVTHKTERQAKEERDQIFQDAMATIQAGVIK